MASPRRAFERPASWPDLRELPPPALNPPPARGIVWVAFWARNPISSESQAQPQPLSYAPLPFTLPMRKRPTRLLRRSHKYRGTLFVVTAAESAGGADGVTIKAYDPASSKSHEEHRLWPAALRGVLSAAADDGGASTPSSSSPSSAVAVAAATLAGRRKAWLAEVCDDPAFLERAAGLTNSRVDTVAALAEGDAHMAGGRFDAAHRSFARAAACSPEEPACRLAVARALLAQNKPRQSIAKFKSTVALVRRIGTLATTLFPGHLSREGSREGSRDVPRGPASGTASIPASGGGASSASSAGREGPRDANDAAVCAALLVAHAYEGIGDAYGEFRPPKVAQSTNGYTLAVQESIAALEALRGGGGGSGGSGGVEAVIACYEDDGDGGDEGGGKGGKGGMGGGVGGVDGGDRGSRFRLDELRSLLRAVNARTRDKLAQSMVAARDGAEKGGETKRGGVGGKGRRGRGRGRGGGGSGEEEEEEEEEEEQEEEQEQEGHEAV